jgi:hypothetical protein
MIVVNLDKAKNIAHDMRRAMRAKEFAPLDVKVTIPSEAVTAEAERQVIRDKYAAMQENIDNATNTEQLKTVLG